MQLSQTNNNTIQNFFPLKFDFNEAISLQELTRCNAQDAHWLGLKIKSIAKHIRQIEAYIRYEVLILNDNLVNRLKLIKNLFYKLNDEYLQLDFYDEKSKNLILSDIEDSMNKLKRFVVSLENDISRYDTH